MVFYFVLFVHRKQGFPSNQQQSKTKKKSTLYVINLHVCMSVIFECTIVHKLHTKSMSSLSKSSVSVAAYFRKHEYYKQKKKLELCVCVSLELQVRMDWYLNKQLFAQQIR